MSYDIERCKACVGDRAERCVELRDAIKNTFLAETHLPILELIVGANEADLEPARLKKAQVDLALKIFEPGLKDGLSKEFFDIGCEKPPAEIAEDFRDMVSDFFEYDTVKGN